MKLIKDNVEKDIQDENLAKAMLQVGWEIKEDKKIERQPERHYERRLESDR